MTLALNRLGSSAGFARAVPAAARRSTRRSVSALALSLLAAAALALTAARTNAAETADARICVGDDCGFSSLREAFSAAEDGDVITIHGVHRKGGILRANGVTIRGANGAHLVDAAVAGKAALIIHGRDAVVEDLECSGSRVPDQNGACIRLIGENLTLRRVHFHDNEMGILSWKNSGRVVIEDSVIERNSLLGGPVGRNHNVYIGSGELIIRGSRILAAGNGGHEVKSRAARTVIEDSVIAGLDAFDSRTVDIPNGGELIIRNSVLQQGPLSSNQQVIAIGLERGRGLGDHPDSRLLLENNTVISDRPRTDFLTLRDVDERDIRGNTFVGGQPVTPRDANTWHATRGMAGLPPYPALPTP